MNVELVTAVLGWCTLINYGLLIFWFLILTAAHDWTYRLHSRWFRISSERFDSIHYFMMGIFKLAVVGFNLVPYVALRIAM